LRLGRKKLFAILSILIFTTNGFVYSESKIQSIDKLVNHYYEFGLLNGCVLVAQNNKIIYENAFGFTDFKRHEKITLDHKFRLASVSKQFTAMAVMILNERDSLSYNDRIRTYFPELPYRYIRIRHLLTHTSGLPDYGALVDEYWDIENKFKDKRKVINNEDVYQLILEHNPPTNFFPGQRYEYCNTGYLLLALIVEKVTGQSFQEFVKTNIFDPLNMNDSYVNPDSGILPDKKRAFGFRTNDQHTGYEPYDNHYQNGLCGDGGIISTVHDLYKWSQALDSDKLVSQETLERAFSAFMLNDSSFSNYGFGWSIIPDDSGKIVAHGGSWLGYHSFILKNFRQNATIIQLTNKPGINRGELVFRISGILNGEAIDMPTISLADELMKIINTVGVKHAREKFFKVYGAEQSEYHINETELMELSERLVAMEKIPEAIEILKLCTLAYPNSFQFYNGLAENYFLIDEGELAIECLQKSLILNPENNLAGEILKDIGLEFDNPPFRTVTFRVIPEVPIKRGNLFITGNHSNLGNWNPGAVKLFEEHDGSWTRRVRLNEGMVVEYKITRGDWSKEAVNEDGSIPPNYIFKVKNDTTIEINVSNWKDLIDTK